MTLLLLLLHDMFFAAVPALGFALVFNVPPKALKYCAFGGALGYGCRFLFLHAGASIEWATLGAATLVSMVGVYWSQRLLAHPKVFTVAAVIPMMPGVFAFKAMIALVEINSLGYSDALWATLMNNAIKSLFIISALAIGLAMPGLLFYRRKSVV